MRLKRKGLIIITVLIAMCLVTLVGSSYALFTRTFTSNKKISVQAGTLKADFAEGNRINLSNVAPMSDNNGMNTTPYTFTITNSGSVTAYYTIRNEEDSSNTLNNKYIKYRLISDNYDSGIKTLDTMGSGYYILSSENTVAVGKSITYKLFLWLSSEADNEAQNKTYQSKIVVQSTTNSISETVATTLLKGVGDNGSIDTSDPEQTFITGTDPNNYIWYSGKLWRAVSIDPSGNSVKLVTQWNISAVSYNEEGNANFKGSIIEQWLNDTSIDGFLGNLREPEKFIKTDGVWNATATTETSKPIKTTMVTDTVGLLNLYEYSKCSENATQETNYLTNGLWWWLLTPKNDSAVNFVYDTGIINEGLTRPVGVRPAINLKSNIKIVSGVGTSDNPYRLENDNDENLSGTLLSKRYSGEYVSFGTNNNNLYRIVSHENETGTKITSTYALMSAPKKPIYTYFDSASVSFSKDTIIGKFLNETFLQKQNYLTTEQAEMIEDNSTWYVGRLLFGENYKLIKYSNAVDNTINTNNIVKLKIGLLRVGELFASQSSHWSETAGYWTLTIYDDGKVNNIGNAGDVYRNDYNFNQGIKPAMNLKSNVVITGGDGTKSNPFTVALQ